MNTTSSAININPETTTGLPAEIGKALLTAIAKVLGDPNIDEKILKVTLPPTQDMGDFAFGCFALAGPTKQSPNEIAEKISCTIMEGVDMNHVIERAEVAGPYVNIFLNRSVVTGLVMNNVFGQKSNYGNNNQTIRTDLTR